MLTRYVFSRSFQPETLGLKLSALYDLRPGDLAIFGLFSNRRAAWDSDALWYRLLDFPQVYEVEVLESNLMLLD